jgi:hypothetical protein
VAYRRAEAVSPDLACPAQVSEWEAVLSAQQLASR